MKTKHFCYTPFTGLGLYNGYRGGRWLKNRIQIFKQFVIPSLLAQTNKNFTLWVSWRPQERNNKQVTELRRWLVDEDIDFIFTYNGVCFYDDKYPDQEAKERLMTSLHGSMNTLVNHIGDVDNVIVTLQPSDDLYNRGMVQEIQDELSGDLEAVGYSKGYIMNYQTGEVKYYNPETNPPFFSYKFTKEQFIDPFKHAEHISLKGNVNQYKVGTPYPSHEYIGDCLKYKQIHARGFLVGCHGENISTNYNIPYAGEQADETIISHFGIENAGKLKIRYSLRKVIMRKLPHRVQRKLRYIFGELICGKLLLIISKK